MIRIAKGDRAYCEAFIQSLKARVSENDRSVEDKVAEILKDVRDNGDEAVRRYTMKFDGWAPEKAEITKEEIDALTADCDPAFIASMERAAENIRAFHARQKQQSRIDPSPTGVLMGQRVRGLHRVGVYVPGGTAAYPSSVIMNAVPAMVAGVPRIVMAAPASRDGRMNPYVLATARKIGITEIYKMGGAQAVAALAFGTETIPKVEKITGPGNIFVTLAKKAVYGHVDIDMLAGPSEILIVADQTGNPKYLAADLLSQAEHDPLACAILITCDEPLARAVAREVDEQLEALPRKEIAETSLAQTGKIILAKDMDTVVQMANLSAPEHMEIMTENAFSLVPRIRNAGAIFLGAYSPEPLGDYYAGPNHILPTGGTARFYSVLNVETFMKKTSLISYTREALKEAADDIIAMAEAEGLKAHANAIRVRKGEL